MESFLQVSNERHVRNTQWNKINTLRMRIIAKKFEHF